MIAIGQAEEAVQPPEALPEQLPVLPLRDTVTFPDTLTPLAVGQPRSITLINDVLAADRRLVMVASMDPDAEEPGPDQLHSVGAHIVGAVLNRADVERNPYYYSAYYRKEYSRYYAKATPPRA